MSCTMEAPISYIQSESGGVQDIGKTMINNDGGCKITNDEVISSIIELFPWMSEFKKMCRSIHTNQSMASLTGLMQFYVRNVTLSVNECYTKPIRAAKLKESISETLLLFLYIYRELSEGHDKYIYLNNMSDLLAMYIDMELKASKRSKEEHAKICARVTSCLYVHLEHSTEHLLDTLLKIQFMCHSYHYILDPLMTKVINDLPAHPESSIMYVRYLLIYRLWRKINTDVAVKKRITTTAIESLGPPPSTFPACLAEDILPHVPACKLDSTKLLLQHKFDIKRSCELFIQFCRDTKRTRRERKDGSIQIDPISLSRTDLHMQGESTEHNNIPLEDSIDSLVESNKNNQCEPGTVSNALKSLNLSDQSISKPLGTISNNVSAPYNVAKSIKSNKSLLQSKLKKSNEIIVIDLTTDVVSEECVKKGKPKKMVWLQEAEKHINLYLTKSSLKMKSPTQCKVDATKPEEKTTSSSHRQEDVLLSSFTSTREDCNIEDTTYCNVRKNAEIVMNKTVNTSEVSTPAFVNDAKSVITTTPMEISSSMTMDEDVDVIIPDALFPSTTEEVLFDSSVKSVLEDASVIHGCDYDVDLVAKTKKNLNKRLINRTVIEKVIDKSVIPKSELINRIESAKKTNVEAECNVVNSTAEQIQNNSKDDNCRLDYADGNIISTSRTKNADSILVENNGTLNRFGDKNVDLVFTVKEPAESRHFAQERNVEDEIKTAATEEVTVVNGTTPFKSCGSVNALSTVNSRKHGDKYMSVICTGNLEYKSDFMHEQETSSLEKDILNSDVVKFNRMDVYRSEVQTELEISNCIEVCESGKDLGLNATNIKRSSSRDAAVVDRSTTYESDIYETFACPEETGADDIQKHSNESIADRARNEYKNSTKQNWHNTGHPDNLESCDTTKDVHSKIYEISRANNACNNSGDKFIVQASEIHENIDGLSLLASVSQHVAHLTTDANSKCEQIKVKDYAFLKSTPRQHLIDEETDTDDSSNIISQLCQNPTAEVINRIVGIYPEDAMDKVALQVEVSSTSDLNSHNLGNVNESGSPDGEIMSNNILSVESSAQPTKDNTNVILNGETVVLLQKSPNSNLYIINKAVENARDHSGDDEAYRLKDQSWISMQEDCASFEVINTSDHAPFGLDIAQRGKEIHEDSKFIGGSSDGIKVEPVGNDLADARSYMKTGSLSKDASSIGQQVYPDVNTLNLSTNKPGDKRKSPSKSKLGYRQSIKQEFSAMPNHITPNCSIQECTLMHSHPHKVVEPQHPVHIPVSHPATLPPICASFPGSTELCMPYHKHCTSVSCSLQINTSSPLHSRAKSAKSCAMSHSSCLNCTYDIVTHCRQCLHATTDSRVSCSENNSYFLSTHSQVQTSTVQEHGRAKGDSVLDEMYRDQLLCKIEQNLLQSESLDKVDAKREPQQSIKAEMDNKLPLKKRLKAHAMLSMSYEEVPIKAEKLDNYPGIPMMSIAALEALDSAQKHSAQYAKPMFNVPIGKKEDSHGKYRLNSNSIRRDFHHNVPKENARRHDRLNQPSNVPACQEAYHDRTFETPALRKEIVGTNVSSSKRFATESIEQDGPYKKAKKTQLPIRQTRSSKRNVPKVNYCYTDVDPEWSSSGESKRKRKKPSRMINTL